MMVTSLCLDRDHPGRIRLHPTLAKYTYMYIMYARNQNFNLQPNNIFKDIEYITYGYIYTTCIASNKDALY